MNGQGTISPKSHPINVNGHLTIIDMDNRTLLIMNGHGSSKSHPKALRNSAHYVIYILGSLLIVNWKKKQQDTKVAKVIYVGNFVILKSVIQ